MTPRPGDRVRLSGRHLAATGQRAGGEGAREWTVLACSCGLCRRGDHVAVDEPSSWAWTPAELEAEPGLAHRHFASANLTLLGHPSLRDELPAAQAPQAPRRRR